MIQSKRFIRASYLLAAVSFSAVAFADVLTSDQKSEVNGMIKQFVQSHPQEIVDSIVQHRQAEAESQAKKVINAHKAEIFDNPQDPFLGTVDAPIQLVEFMDYQCGHCQDTGPLLEEFVAGRNDVKLTIKMLPIFGDVSVKAGKAALAAFEQGQDKFRKIHKILLANRGALKPEAIEKATQDSGVDVVKAKKVAESDAVQKQLDKNFDLARSTHVAATPTFMVLDRRSGGVALMAGLPEKGGKQALNDVIRKVQKGE